MYCRPELRGQGLAQKTSPKWCSCGYRARGKNHENGKHHNKGKK